MDFEIVFFSLESPGKAAGTDKLPRAPRLLKVITVQTQTKV